MGKTPTKQSFKDECDINKIISKFQRTGVVTHVNKHAGQYGFAPAIDFQSALALVAQARDQFADLPSKIRSRFGNDPQQFLAFCENPDNRSEMALLGLLKPEPPELESPPPQPAPSEPAPSAPNPADSEPESA